MKNHCLLCLFLSPFFLLAQNPSLGIFQNQVAIGVPRNIGAARYEAASQTYFLKSSGYHSGSNRDGCQFAYEKRTGDFVLTAHFAFVGTGKDPLRQMGWMVRANTQADAVQISAAVQGNGLTALQWRLLRGAFRRDPEDKILCPKKNLQILQLERQGKTFTMRVANWGEPLQTVGTKEMDPLGDSVLVGLFIAVQDSLAVEEARVWNVRIDKPVADDYIPSRQGYLGSRLEIINPFDGVRKVIHTHTGRFEAPNWMPDGKRLLFNQDGSLWLIPTEGGATELFNTGFANRNNNDHGISFDGKQLAISHHRQGLPGGGSTIYVLPLTGGEPKLVTEKTPSYWHGWNPNGQEVLYVALREERKAYNIYKIATNGGAEVALTQDDIGHNDGPEFSPDGRFIYYNANPTGTMQIWRMKPDGSAREQLTFDEYHNWFPHISPDGKWLVMISFPPTIEPNAHPSYKRVLLRLMPVAGGAPRVIAYLYGGQGTINVPSWSPDSKFLAFVSNF